MNVLVSGHLSRCIIVGVVGGALFGALGHRQNKNGAEHVRKPCAKASAKARTRRWKRFIS